MTREEAITVFKAFMDNPLFSDVHKSAFSIAIHDIKQRHEWNINKLMLVPKSEWEQDHAILKAYSDGVNEVLDKIRAEIIMYEGDCRLSVDEYPSCKQCTDSVFETIYGILDKYKGESEVV